MTSKDFAIKTAKLCGYDPVLVINKLNYWNPEENLDQAFEVLEATNLSWSIDKQIIDKSLPPENSKKDHFYEVCLFDKMTRTIVGLDESNDYPRDLKQAICEAVKKWILTM